MKRLALTAFAVAFLASAPAMATPRNGAVFPEAARAVDGGRAVHVLVPQTELRPQINTSNVSAAMGGGLLGALIDSSVDANRSRRADDLIAPIRAALTNFDADALATDTTNAALANLDWFQPQTPAFGRDASLATKSAALDAGTASQVAFFEYAYNVSPDFSAMHVTVTVSIANKTLNRRGRPESRLSARNLVFAQTLTSAVVLANPATAEENAARWAANDAALTRNALTAAFTEIGVLIPRAMQMTDDEVRTAARGARRTVSGSSGRLVEESPSGTLLYAAGLIHVQTLQE